MDREIYYLIQVFCTVVEFNSFSKAAEKLNVQAPAVSKNIVKLENLLGKKLFNRTTRNIELTEVGKMLYREALQQLSSLNNLLDKVNSWKTVVKGSLRLTCTPAVGENIITKYIGQFCQRYPSITVDLLFSNDVINLPSQSIDIALRSRNELENSSLISKKLLDVKRKVVASSEFIKQHGKPGSVDELVKFPCLNFVHGKRFCSWKYTSEMGEGRINTESAITCNSYNAIKEMCTQGLGIARLFDYQIVEDLKSGNLVELFPEIEWTTQKIHGIYHERSSDSPKVKAFLDHFTASVIDRSYS